MINNPTSPGTASSTGMNESASFEGFSSQEQGTFYYNFCIMLAE